MEDFKDNKCRICNILFCCILCREKHETNKHNIFPECDICVYGKTVLKNPSEALLMHLQTIHWPLHCVLCKKRFRSTEELLRQCKCSLEHKIADEDAEKSPAYFPWQSQSEYTYESPPLSVLYPNSHEENKNKFSSLATSTPMQKGEENNLLEKMQGITPVDYSENNKSIIKKKLLNSNRSGSPKKVTFSDTPLADHSNKELKNMLKKEECQSEDAIFSTPNLCTTFYSVSEEVPQENTRLDENNEQPINRAQNDASAIIIIPIASKVDENNEESNKQSQNAASAVTTTNTDVIIIKGTNKPGLGNTPVKQEDSATWLSAIDVSATELIDKKIPTSPKINLYTPIAPMVGKFKKRQVNIVLPTPSVVKKEEISITIDLPLPVFSTPMPFESDLARSDKELPAISKPNTSIVCKEKENPPSISEVELEDLSNVNQQENSNTEYIPSHTNGLEGETSTDTMRGRLWSLMSKVTSIIGQGFSSIDEGVIRNAEFSLKRSVTSDDLLDAPPAKRCKLTEVKCRRTIRNLPNFEVTRGNTRIIYTAQSMKIFVDKATQTDD